MARSVFIVLCLAGILLCNLHARESDSRPEASAPVRLLKTAAGDLWHVASAPLRLSRRDALMVSSLAAVQLGLIYGGDGHLDREFGGEAHASYLAPAEELADIGDLYDRLGPARVFTGLWTGFLSGGILLGDKKMRETALLLLESGVITTTSTYLGKGLFGRARPFTGQGARQFSLFSFSKDGAFRALPSGHTSGAFAMMTVIAIG